MHQPDVEGSGSRGWWPNQLRQGPWSVTQWSLTKNFCWKVEHPKISVWVCELKFVVCAFTHPHHPWDESKGLICFGQNRVARTCPNHTGLVKSKGEKGQLWSFTSIHSKYKQPDEGKLSIYVYTHIYIQKDIVHYSSTQFILWKCFKQFVHSTAHATLSASGLFALGISALCPAALRLRARRASLGLGSWNNGRAHATLLVTMTKEYPPTHTLNQKYGCKIR